MSPPNTRSLKLAKQAALLLASGDLKGARQPLRRILSLRQNSDTARVQAHLSLARIDQLQGNWKGVETHTKALLSDLFNLDAQQRAETLRMRALLAMRDGDRTKHLDHLNEARSLFHSADDIHNALSTLAESIETLTLAGQPQRALDLLDQTIKTRAHEIPEADLHGFCIQRAIMTFALEPEDVGHITTVEHLLQHALDEHHDRVVAVMRIRWGQTLMEHARCEEAIQHLNQARLDAVANAEILLYTQACLALAQAYEENDQKEEAYGTLLRAKTSLQDIVGPEGGDLPQLVLDQLKERWTTEVFDEVVRSFHTSYNVLH